MAAIIARLTSRLTPRVGKRVGRPSTAMRPRTPAAFKAARRRLIFMNLGLILAVLAILWVVIAGLGAYFIDQQLNQQLIGWAAHEQPTITAAFASANEEGSDHSADSAESRDSETSSAAPTGLGVCKAPAATTTATAITSTVTTTSTAKTPALTEPTETQCLYSPTSPNLFSVTVGANRQIVADDIYVQRYGLPDMAPIQAALTQHARPSFVTYSFAGHGFRLYTVAITVNGKVVGAMQSGVSLDSRNQQVADLLEVLLLIMLVVLALTVGSSVFLTERALIPARQAFVRQRQFAAAASHELRTPLALIRSQAELTLGELHDLKARAGQQHETRLRLAARAGSPSDAARMRASTPRATAPATTDIGVMATDVEEIITEVDFMSRMVSDLLLLARDERAEYHLTHERLDIAALVSAATAKMRPLAEANHLTLDGPTDAHTTRIPSLVVLGDADRLRQLLFILLDNAIRYTPTGGAITVELQDRPQMRLLGVGGVRRSVLLVVRDTGVGIPGEHIPHLFEPFYRPHGARNATNKTNATTMDSPDTTNGTGLGLALAAWIAHSHGGEIRVESVIGKGSVFTVTLPLAETPSA